MSIELPLGKKHILFGNISDPIIEVEILTRFGFEPVKFLLDSGADCTMLPRRFANILGIDLTKCPVGISYGITNEPVKAFSTKITIKIKKTVLPIRCLITDRDDTPLLLGRCDLFSKFAITFDQSKNRIVLKSL